MENIVLIGLLVTALVFVVAASTLAASVTEVQAAKGEANEHVPLVARGHISETGGAHSGICIEDPPCGEDQGVYCYSVQGDEPGQIFTACADTLEECLNQQESNPATIVEECHFVSPPP